LRLCLLPVHLVLLRRLLLLDQYDLLLLYLWRYLQDLLVLYVLLLQCDLLLLYLLLYRLVLLCL
jgi:hypothetical protein